MISRRTKLDFEPLSLRETAKQLGIPPKRARRILSLFGVEFENRNANRLGIRRKKRRRKISQK